jgi:ABC-type nitrate/sulfonate/bicarbonate transport system substrate-binding protein
VDLVSSSEPAITQVVSSGAGVVFQDSSDAVPGFQSSFVAYGVNFLQRDPETGKKFMVAYLQAARRYQEGRTESNVETVVGFTHLDKAVVSQVCWAPLSATGDVDVAALLDFQQWAVNRGLLDTVVPPEKLADTRFLDYAHDALGKGT